MSHSRPKFTVWSFIALRVDIFSISVWPFSPITTHFKPLGVYKPGDDYINYYVSDSLISTPKDTWWPTRMEEHSQNVFGWIVMKLFFSLIEETRCSSFKMRHYRSKIAKMKLKQSFHCGCKMIKQ